MPKQQIIYQALPYFPDATALFSVIRTMPHACWLDSGKPKSHSGRYDIISALPDLRIVTEGYLSRQYQRKYKSHPTQQWDDFCTEHEYEVTAESTTNPFDLIKAALKPLEHYKNIPPSDQELPFWGGAIGYFGYDLSRRDYPMPNETDERCHLADMAVGIYHWAIIQDHHKQTCWLASIPGCDTETVDHVRRKVMDLEEVQHSATSAMSPTLSIGELSSNTLPNEYRSKLNSINHYIRAGDCYQVNFSQCFSAPYQGDPYSAYAILRHTMASPFSAYIDLGEQAIMSLSPERFLQTFGREVLTQPIKGTMPRGKTPASDEENATILRESAKNQAENVMIVDLLRNDLGKNCVPGSIKVPKLFELESFSNVHHLVSSVTGLIKEDKSSIDVFRDAFPGGSITGAPKKRAMEIIEELENYRRSIYCGSIAYINLDGDLDSNIAIRTIACDKDRLYCWGGGGIVADSDIDEEYQESLTKIDSLLQILATFSDKSAK